MAGPDDVLIPNREIFTKIFTVTGLNSGTSQTFGSSRGHIGDGRWYNAIDHVGWDMDTGPNTEVWRCVTNDGGRGTSYHCFVAANPPGSFPQADFINCHWL